MVILLSLIISLFFPVNLTAKSLIGYWKLNEGLGSTVYDYSKYKTNGKIYRAKWVKGYPGDCLEFNRKASFVFIPHRDTFDLKKEFTFSAWIYPYSISEGDIFSNGDSYRTGCRFFINDGRIGIIVKPEKNKKGRAGSKFNSKKVLKENEWSYIAVTYSCKGNKIKIYHNGKKIGERNAYGEISFAEYWEDKNISHIIIGALSTFPGIYGQYYGLIREVKVYDYALSEEEIKNDYLESVYIAKIDVLTSKEREEKEFTCLIKGKVVDKKTKKPLEAFITLSVNGKYYYPEDTLYWGDRKRAEFLSLKKGFELKVPKGKVKITVRRGLEYYDAVKEFEIKEGGKKEILLEIERFVDMNSLGWYGGEHHLHSWGHGKGKTYEFFQRKDGWKWWSSAVKAAGFNYVSSPSPYPKGDYKSCWDKDFICAPTWEGGPWCDETCKIWKSTRGGGICMIPDLLTAEKQGGLAVPQGYLDNPLLEGNFFNPNIYAFDRSFPVAVALNLVYIWDVYYRGRIDTERDWYRYLNCGFKLGIGAGSDCYLSLGPPPETKEYTKLEKLTWPEVIKGYKKRATFFTSGPLVIFKINNKEIGDVVLINEEKDLDFDIKVWDKYGIEKIVLIKNGKIKRAFSIKDKKNSVEKKFKVRVNETCWFALKVYNVKKNFAHTSPIYIQYKKEPIKPKKEDLNYFLKWISMYRKFVTEQAKKKGVSEKVLNQTLKWIDEAERTYKSLFDPKNYKKWEN